MSTIPIPTNPISLGLKFKNLAGEIRTHLSTNKKILASLDKLKEVSVKSAETAKKTTQTAVVHAHNATIAIALKFPVLLAITLALIIYGGTIIPFIYNNILTLVGFLGNYLNLTIRTIAWLTFTITAYIILNGLLLTIPIGKLEGKLDFITKKENTFLFILIILILLFNYFFDGTYQATQNQQIVLKNAQSNWQSLVDTISCSMSYECAMAKQQEKTADTTTRIEYSIDFTPPATFVTTQDLKFPLELFYKVQGDTQLKFTKIDCYYNSKDDKHKFYSEKFETPKTMQAAVSTPIDGIVCKNLDKIELKAEKIQDITIIPVLTSELGTHTSFSIPEVDYTKFVESQAMDTSRTYSYQYLKESLDTQTKNYKDITTSNNGLDMSASLLTSKLPLLLGDGEENARDLTFVLTISKNQNDFGKFISGEITNIILPKGIKFQEGGENYKRKIQFDADKFQQNIRIQEDESYKLSELTQVDKLEMDTISTFEKSSNFKLTLSLTNQEVAALKAKEATSKQSSTTQSTTTTSDLLKKLGTPDSNGIYQYGADLTASNLYYKYDSTNNQWLWSPNKETWMTLYEEQVKLSSSTYSGETLSAENLDFIRKLRISNPNPNLPQGQTTQTQNSIAQSNDFGTDPTTSIP